jgi:hypothetical protein
VLPLAASRINWAISSGWDTGDAWLELSEIVVAFIRCANIRSASAMKHTGNCGRRWQNGFFQNKIK